MLLKLGTALLFFAIFAAEDCGTKSSDGQSAKPAESTASQTSAESSKEPGRAGVTVSDASAKKSDASADEKAGVPVDVCSMVEPSEVETVQGAKVSDARANKVTRGPFAVSQCLYTVTAADKPGQNLSVLVEVRRPDSSAASADALATEWSKLRDKRENKRSERPRPVEGVGREAFWVGSDKLGALYVLSKDALVYVSVGGADGVDAKIEKARKLAARALARL